MLPSTPINKLTARWIATLPSDPTACSGLCVWPLLALLADAAEGAARDELGAAAGIDPSDGTAASLAVIDWLAAAEGLSAALGVWHRRDMGVRNEWRSRLPEGVVEAFSGDLGADQRALNDWVSSRTAGRIERMPVRIDESTRMLLASALTVDTRWREPFQPHAGLLRRETYDQSIVRVAPDVTCVRVEGDNGIDVHLALGVPDATASAVLGAAIGVLDGETDAESGERLPEGTPGHGIVVDTVEASDTSPRVVLGTKAFTVRGSHDLLAIADVLGLGAISDCSRGHTPAISDFPLCVGAAAQDAMAEFSEEGFRAAAVSSVAMRAGMARPIETYRVRRITVTIDRPFGFLATHRETGLILVAGWVLPD
jgi:hypothetical protein